MYCTKCGKEVKENVICCTNCGAQMIENEAGLKEEQVLIQEATKNSEQTDGLRIFFGIVSIVLWGVIFKVFFDVFRAKEKDFRSWYNMYDNYGSINLTSKIIFYGVIIGVGIFSIIGIMSAIKRNRKYDLWSMISCIFIIITFLIMRKYVDITENHFLDTANIYMKYVANAVYVKNIENSIYVYLGINLLVIKLKQIAGKY